MIKSKGRLKAMYNLNLNKEKCINCGTCADVCKSAKVYGLKGNMIEAIHQERCWECYACIAACPKGAIEYIGEQAKMPESIQNDGLLIDVLRARRSVRIFNGNQVDRDTIIRLLNSSKWAPSAQNEQFVKWIYIDSRERIKQLEKDTINILKSTAGLLKNPALRPVLRIVLGNSKYIQAEENAASFEKLALRYNAGESPIFHDAPVLLFAVTPEGKYFGKEDSIYSSYNIMLSAHQMGLGTCRIGYFDVALERNKALSEQILGKGSGLEIQVTMVLGYPKYKVYNMINRRDVEIKSGNS